MVDVRAEQRIRFLPAVHEDGLEDDAVAVAVVDHGLVLSPGEGAVDEEFHSLGAVLGEAGDELAGVDEQVPPAFEVHAFRFHPRLEAVGAGENADTLLLAEAMARFLSDEAGIAVEVGFRQRTGGHPELVDLDAALPLVCGRMPEPEELAHALAMVVVEMREADHVEVVPPRPAEHRPQLLGEVAALLVRIVRIVLVPEVDEQQLLVRELKQGAVGVSERIEGRVGGHLGVSFSIEFGACIPSRSASEWSSGTGRPNAS